MGVHGGVALNGYRNPGVRLNVPHGIDQITGVFGPQLQSDLTPQFAGGQGLAGSSGAEIAEANFRDLIRDGLRAHDRPRTWCIDREPAAGRHRNDSIGNAEVIAIHWLQGKSGLARG